MCGTHPFRKTEVSPMARSFLAAAVLAVTLPSLSSRAEPQGYTFHDLGKVYGMAASEGRVIGPIQFDPGYHAFVWSVADGMIHLGTLPGGSASWSLSGGAGGVVFGVSNAADGDQHAFRWSAADGMVDLGALFPGAINVRVANRGANSSGHIVGSFGVPEWPRAFSWTPEGLGIDLGAILRPLRPDAANFGSRAVAVSEQGEVVGMFWTQNYPDPFNGHAFYWKEGQDPIDLGTDLVNGPDYHQTPYPPSSAPTDVDAGQVIGQCGGNVDVVGRYVPGFSWTQDSGLVDIGTLGWPSGDVFPYRVRDGEIAGFAFTAAGPMHAFSGTADGITDLHPPEWTAAGWPVSQAADVRAGQIAGTRYSSSGSSYHAMLWTGDGEWFDLHPCGWRGSFASAWSSFDELGTIVVNGYDAQFNFVTGVYVPGGEPLVPDDITVSAPPGESSAVVTFDVAACVVASPSSGSSFPCGTTTVHLTKEGAPAGSFQVTVEGEPPAISCPADIHLCGGGAVTWPAPVATGGCGTVSVECVPSSGSTFPEGSTTAVCEATDDAAATATCSFEVVAESGAFDGFLPPIGAIGGSFVAPVRAFKLGSTIPVKFRTLCGGAPRTGGQAPRIAVAKWSSSTTPATPIDATPTDAATEGDQARATGDEWHFNLSTKPLSRGVWQIVVTLEDGTTRSVFVELK